MSFQTLQGQNWIFNSFGIILARQPGKLVRETLIKNIWLRVVNS